MLFIDINFDVPQIAISDLLHIMQQLKARPAVVYTLILLSASFNICIVGYDANLLGDLNIVPQYIEYFGLTNTTLGLNLAIISAGQVIGGPIAGVLLDRFGRRKGLIISSVLIVISGIIQSTSTTGK
jgi:MFS family permease